MLDEGLHPTSEVLLGDIEQEEGRLAMIESLPVEDVLGASRPMEEGERGVTELDARAMRLHHGTVRSTWEQQDDLAVHGIQAPTEAFVSFLPQLEDGHIRDIMNVAHGGEQTGRNLTSSTSIIRGGPDEGLPRRGGGNHPPPPVRGCRRGH